MTNDEKSMDAVRIALAGRLNVTDDEARLMFGVLVSRGSLKSPDFESFKMGLDCGVFFATRLVVHGE